MHKQSLYTPYQIYLILYMEIYNTITLPNGGTVAMDKLAYAAYQSISSSSHKDKWATTLYFDNDEIETATANETKKREYR